MNDEQPGGDPPADATDKQFVLCGVCQRWQPFTAAILAGLPLSRICTCALESRMLARIEHQGRLREPGVTYLR